MELMGPTLLSVQRGLPSKQLPLGVGRRMTTQVLQALDWLHHSCHVIHTDIKPDNILIGLPNVNDAVEHHLADIQERSDDPEASRLTSQPISTISEIPLNEINFKIADFGVASWQDNHLTEWIQPPSLRAPEVFLGAPWDYSADIWNFACVVYELLQGRVLFKGRAGPINTYTAEEDQLVQMIELFGPIPTSLLSRGKLSGQYLDDEGHSLHIKQLHPYSFHRLVEQTKNCSMSTEDYEHFESFLQDMLIFEPGKRKSAKELVEYPWLKEESGRI